MTETYRVSLSFHVKKTRCDLFLAHVQKVSNFDWTVVASDWWEHIPDKPAGDTGCCFEFVDCSVHIPGKCFEPPD